MANSMITQVGRDGEQAQAPGYRKKKSFWSSVCCCFGKDEEEDGREMSIVGQNVSALSCFFFVRGCLLVGDG